VKAENRQNSTCTDEVDRELLKRYRGGDKTAFDELFRLHSKFFKKWVRRVLNEAPWVERDEILHEVHIAFFLAVEKFDFSVDGTFDGYANKCAFKAFDGRGIRVVKKTLYSNYSKVINAQERLLKKSDHTPTFEELGKEADLTERQVKTALNVISSFTFPLDKAEGVLSPQDPYQRQLLRELMTKLSPVDVQIFIHHNLFDETYGEIGDKLSLPESTVKKRHQRAIERLRRIMQDEGNREDGT
jgi:RNA polymerase sigma factor (sigma-70 family)